MVLLLLSTAIAARLAFIGFAARSALPALVLARFVPFGFLFGINEMLLVNWSGFRFGCRVADAD